MKITKKIENTINDIISIQRKRSALIKMINAQTSQIVSFITSQFGYHSFLEEDDRKKIWTKAEKVFSIIVKIEENNQKKLKNPEKIIKDIEIPEEYKQVIENVFIVATAANLGIEALKDQRKRYEVIMEGMVKTLPIHDYWTMEKGCGSMGLAVLIGEIGNLSNYANPAKVWKRMGVAVLDGIRQGGLTKNSSKEAWKYHGYNKKRRSVLWTIGDCLIKTNGKDGRYRKIYDERKIYEINRIEKSEDKPKYPAMAAHRRAQRYMEKTLLRDLWNEWTGNKYVA